MCLIASYPLFHFGTVGQSVSAPVVDSDVTRWKTRQTSSTPRTFGHIVSSHDRLWLVSLLEQLSASLAVMLLLQAEQSVVPDTVREVKRCPLL